MAAKDRKVNFSDDDVKKIMEGVPLAPGRLETLLGVEQVSPHYDEEFKLPDWTKDLSPEEKKFVIEHERLHHLWKSAKNIPMSDGPIRPPLTWQEMADELERILIQMGGEEQKKLLEDWEKWKREEENK